MKTVLYLIVLLINILVYVHAQGWNSNEEYDDIYFNKKDRVYEENNSQNNVKDIPYSNYSGNQNNSDDYYNTNNSGTPDTNQRYEGTVINNYYGDNYSYNGDDYYDYAYASRIRRFYNPVNTFGYYDPFYTNMYWYNYDPFFYGTSIYSSYSWWNPSPWGVNISWGWGSCGYGSMFNNWGWNNGWGPSYYGGYYGFSYMNPWGGGFGWGGYDPYWNGYNNGYNNGYYHGYYNGLYASNYYNSYDANSYYYGPRQSSGSNSGVPRRDRTLGEKYQLAYGQQAVNSKYVETKQITDIRNINSKPVKSVTNNNIGSVNTATLPSKNNTSAVVPKTNDVRNIHSLNNSMITNPKVSVPQKSVTSVKPSKNTMQIPSVKGNPRTFDSKNYSSPKPNYEPVKGNTNVQGKDYTAPRNDNTPSKNNSISPSNTPRDNKPSVTPMPDKGSGKQVFPNGPNKSNENIKPAPKMDRSNPTPSNSGGGRGNQHNNSMPKMNNGGGSSSPSPAPRSSGGNSGGGRTGKR